jgi:hypothetical protein
MFVRGIACDKKVLLPLPKNKKKTKKKQKQKQIIIHGTRSKKKGYTAKTERERGGGA